MNAQCPPVTSNLDSRAGRNWALLEPAGGFVSRHNGPSDDEVAVMLQTLNLASLDELVDKTVPAAIRISRKLALPAPLSRILRCMTGAVMQP